MSEIEERVMTGTGPGEPLEPAAVEAAFVERWEAARVRIEYIARRARGEDPENLVAEVRARCWVGFAAKYREEVEAVAAGGESPHKWVALFCRAARSMAIDEHRQRKVRDRVLGQRLTREPMSAERSYGLLTPDRGLGWGVGELPVDCDSIVDERVRSPEEEYEYREVRALLRPALESLPHDERVAIWSWAQGVPQAITGRRLRCSRFALMRLCRRALEGLREFYRGHGYECPVTRTTVRLRRRPSERD